MQLEFIENRIKELIEKLNATNDKRSRKLIEDTLKTNVAIKEELEKGKKCKTIKLQ